jgi:trans-aconitate 2-methyltransferase
MTHWDPQLYLTFNTERTQPAIDLVQRVNVQKAKAVIDLGCGPGNSTAVLRARWPDAQLTGLDSDPAMLAQARTSDATVQWMQADAGSWQPKATYDVVFSNALLQWVPDHAALLPRLIGAVAPGGALAVQIPAHVNSRLHQHILVLANSPKWSAVLGSVPHGIISHDVGFYYDVLRPHAARLDLWETEYVHVMENAEAILTWIRATGLRPFLQALSDDVQRTQFENDLLELVKVSYPQRADGKVLFPFRRLFFVAYRDR